MLCADSKGVRHLKETQGDDSGTMAKSSEDQPAPLLGRTALHPEGRFRDQTGRRRRTWPCQAEGRTDLHHGLLVLAELHLRCGQVHDAALHWVLVTVIDEDIRATDHNKMLSPVAGKWLLEMQVSFLRNHGAKTGQYKRGLFLTPRK